MAMRCDRKCVFGMCGARGLCRYGLEMWLKPRTLWCDYSLERKPENGSSFPHGCGD
jgi:hypothetical protein